MNLEEYINSPLPIQDELLRLFKREDKLVFFDIGCCEGEDSIRYARLFPKATIYAFEPVQDNFKKVVSNINKYNCHNVQPTNLALSDKRGTAEFYVSSGHPDHLPRTDEWNYGNKSSSLLEPDKTKKIYPWISFDKRSQVATDTLYNFCTENNIQGIDFAHIDVQGAELMVLNGASSLINQIKSIWIEVEAISLYRKQPLRKEVESFMKKNGFKKIKDTIEEVYGEQLFVNTRFF